MAQLSVVLITKNQAWNVNRLIESVLRETARTKNCQVVLVDSASTDQTVVLACGYPIDILQLDPDQRLTAAAGRYIGQTHTAGDYILFLDGDMEMCGNWLSLAIDLLSQSPGVAAVTGAVVNVHPEGGIELRGALPSQEAQRDVRACGGAGLFRRSVLQEVGTFNPYLYSEEEPELCLRIRRAGYRIVQLGQAIANHYSASDSKLSTLIARWNRNLYVGFGQVLRYQATNKLFWTYVRERGFVVLPGLALLTGLVSAGLLLLGSGARWFECWCALAVSFVLYSGVQKRSFERTLASLISRALGLAGTVKGLMLQPQVPQEYHAKLRMVRSSADPI